MSAPTVVAWTCPTPELGQDPTAYSTTAITIANGQSQTGALDLGTLRLAGVLVDPAGWTAAKVSFLVSHDGTTFAPLYSTAGEVASAANQAAGDFVAVAADSFRGVRFLKVRSGTAASPTTQGADRALVLVAAARAL